jgi:RNA polymerase sigma-70 factor (ECF subfamily)
MVAVMESAPTTVAVQRYLDELHLVGPDSLAETVVRDVLSHAARRLHILSASLLRRSYGRLTRPPLSLEAEDVLSAVVERLLKALREARPKNVRMFFALANQHMRWELNDLARRLDERTPAVAMRESVADQEISESVASANTLRILQAIDDLPEHEREVFGLVRVQGLTHAEAAAVLDVSTKTVQRRLNRCVLLLSERVGDLRKGREDSAEA